MKRFRNYVTLQGADVHLSSRQCTRQQPNFMNNAFQNKKKDIGTECS